MKKKKLHESDYKAKDDNVYSFRHQNSRKTSPECYYDSNQTVEQNITFGQKIFRTKSVRAERKLLI
jgi:hypothetical protein